MREQLEQRFRALAQHYNLKCPPSLNDGWDDAPFWRALAMKMAFDLVPCFRSIRSNTELRPKGGRPKIPSEPSLLSPSPELFRLVYDVDQARSEGRQNGCRETLEQLIVRLKSERRLPPRIGRLASSTIKRMYHQESKRQSDFQRIVDSLPRDTSGLLFGLPVDALKLIPEPDPVKK